jgi:hypothetical protein
MNFPLTFTRLGENLVVCGAYINIEEALKDYSSFNFENFLETSKWDEILADFRSDPLHQNVALHMFNIGPEGIPEQADGFYLHVGLFMKVINKCPPSLRHKLAVQVNKAVRDGILCNSYQIY